MKKNPWSKKSVIFSAFVILLIVFTFVMLGSYYTVSSDGRFVKHPTCYDSDGLNFYKKGVVVVNSYEIYNAKEDQCIENVLIEYLCNPTQADYLSTVVFCRCDNGRCA